MDFYLPWTGRMTCTWWLPDLLLFPPLQEFLRSLHLAAECTRNEISITKLAVISTAQHSNQEFSEGLFITTDSVLHQVIHEYWWGEGRIKRQQEKKKNQKLCTSYRFTVFVKAIQYYTEKVWSSSRGKTELWGCMKLCCLNTEDWSRATETIKIQIWMSCIQNFADCKTLWKLRDYHLC